jgi:hypothetical protein
MLRTLAAAEKVARYRHAQLSAVRLPGDINAGNNEDVTLDELLVTIKSELVKLGALIGPPRPFASSTGASQGASEMRRSARDCGVAR